MKINRLYILLLLTCPSLFCIGQDTTNSTHTKKVEIDVKLGGYYKNSFKKKYIKPTPYKMGNNFLDNQYERFTKMPTDGFQVDLIFLDNINKKWSYKLGLIFCNRRMIFKTPIDTVIKYRLPYTNFRLIQNVIKYDYTYNNIGIPILISYNMRKTTLSAGVIFSAWTFWEAKYTYVINNDPQMPIKEAWATQEKTVQINTIPLMFFPTLQISYSINIKKFDFKPFIGIDFGARWSYYLKAGIEIPIITKNKSKK